MNWYEYMWIKMADIPQDIIDQCGLTAKLVNEKVLVEIRKDMYGLKQAGRIANDRLKKTPQSLWVCTMQIHTRDIYSH